VRGSSVHRAAGLSCDESHRFESAVKVEFHFIFVVLCD
jgi:hypothetical protein